MTIKINLFSQFQRQAKEILPELQNSGFDFLLQHQQDHYQALADNEIVINTNETGTGKTLASLLHLLRPKMKDSYSGNTLMIAPTNELIKQHADDVQNFVNKHSLPHVVIRLSAEVITKLVNKNNWRRGEAFYNLVQNPRDPTIADLLGITNQLDQRRPIFLVTNPDLFYYALQGSYSHLDRRNLTVSLIGNFRYIIVDEFHYYTPKQVAAFFLYIALLATFGFFVDDCKMSFLTATPESEVDSFFANLNSLGIRVKAVHPQPVLATDLQATMSTTEVSLEFQESDEGISKVISREVDRIRNYLAKQRDVAIISSSLAEISETTQCFNKNEYQTITGAVSSPLRSEAALSQLILATPTVDIGYNFSRPGKNRQGLDDLYFTASFLDEFLQRLGRAGRVVKKAVQNVTSNVVCVINPLIYKNLQQLNIEQKTLGRNELAKLLKDKGVFPKRNAFWNYVASEGLFENSQALKKLQQAFTAQERHYIEKAYNYLVDILGVSKPPSWRKLLGRLSRYEKLGTEFSNIKDNNKLELSLESVREFAAEIAKNRLIDNESEDELEEKAKEFLTTQINLLKQRISTDKPLKDQYSLHIQKEYWAIRNMFSFRDSFSGIPAAIYDKHSIFHPKQKLTQYDILHLIKNYDFYSYPTKQQFINDVTKIIPLEQVKEFLDNDLSLYVRIDEMLSRKSRRRVELNLTVNDLRLFEKLETDRVRAFNGLKLAASLSDGKQRVNAPLDPTIVTAIANEFIVMLVLSRKTFPMICHKLQLAGFFPMNLVVTDQNSLSDTFSAIVGTNAYYISRLAFGLRSALERYEDFYIC